MEMISTMIENFDLGIKILKNQISRDNLLEILIDNNTYFTLKIGFLKLYFYLYIYKKKIIFKI